MWCGDPCVLLHESHAVVWLSCPCIMWQTRTITSACHLSMSCVMRSMCCVTWIPCCYVTFLTMFCVTGKNHHLCHTVVHMSKSKESLRESCLGIYGLMQSDIYLQCAWERYVPAVATVCAHAAILSVKCHLPYCLVWAAHRSQPVHVHLCIAVSFVQADDAFVWCTFLCSFHSWHWHRVFPMC